MTDTATTTVLAYRGTGEVLGQGMLADFATYLSPSFQVVHVDFPATLGPVGRGIQIQGVALDTAVRIGASNGLALAQKYSPGKIALLGYSLGALVVDQILTELTSSTVRGDLDVMWALNIANPGRRAGESLGDVCGAVNFGLHGQRVGGPADIPVIELANPHDMITNCDPLSPIRRISDAISPFSLAAVEGIKFGDVTHQLKYRRGQEALWQFWNPAFWARYRQAEKDVMGYIRTPPTEHGIYMAAGHHFPGTQETWNEHGAKYINDLWG